MNTTAIAARPQQTISNYHRSLLVLFILPFAFDLSTQVGGNPLQFGIAGINTLSFVLIAAHYDFVVPRKGLAAFLVGGYFLFVLVSSVGALLHDVPFGHYIRIAYQYILFLEGVLVAWWIARRNDAATQWVMTIMLVTAAISLFVSLWWGFTSSGKSAVEIRYIILSPMLPFVLVACGCDLLLFSRHRLRSVALLLAAAIVIMLAVTRALIVVLIAISAAAFVSVFWNTLRTGKLHYKFVVGGLVGIAGVLAFLVFANLFAPDIVARWVHRSTGGGSFVTFWTRAAAVVGQFDSLNSHAFGWVTGLGFGSSYPWPVSKFPWILQYLSNDYWQPVWFPGEFMWMPFLFYGGFIAGVWVILAFVIVAVGALRLLIRQVRERTWKDIAFRPAWIAAFTFFAYLGRGMTANPFGSRSSTLFMGLCVGLVVVYCWRLRKGYRERPSSPSL